MADPATMAGIGIASTAMGGISSAAGNLTTAAGKQLDIQGSILKTVGQAFQFQTEAATDEYKARVDEYQAGVAEVNRKIALGNASYSLDVGETAASEEGLKDAAARSTTKTAQSAQGISVNEGSAVNVRESMIELAQTNEAVIRANAAKVAYNYQVEATQDSAQRDLYTYSAGEERAQAANALKASDLTMQAIPLEQQAYSLAGDAGNIAAGGSLLSATASVASKWQEASTLKLFG